MCGQLAAVAVAVVAVVAVVAEAEAVAVVVGRFEENGYPEIVTMRTAVGAQLKGARNR